MAFSAANFVMKSPKPMHVFLLLDTSGSMFGEKISNLTQSVKDMLSSFENLDNEVELKVTVITFADAAQTLMQCKSPGTALEMMPELFQAQGLTAMGGAFSLVKELIEDRSIVPGRAYRPLIVLVSDGEPTDQYTEPLNALTCEGRSQKAQRLALAIGQHANLDVLQDFIGPDQSDDTMPHLFRVSEAKDIHKFFKFVTMSVTATTSKVATKQNTVVQTRSSNQIADALGDDLHGDLPPSGFSKRANIIQQVQPQQPAHPGMTFQPRKQPDVSTQSPAAPQFEPTQPTFAQPAVEPQSPVCFTPSKQPQANQPASFLSDNPFGDAEPVSPFGDTAPDYPLGDAEPAAPFASNPTTFSRPQAPASPYAGSKSAKIVVADLSDDDDWPEM